MRPELFTQKLLFDLLGDPIPVDQGRIGRPSHLITSRNISKFNALMDAGWRRRDIAKALGISEPTLRKVYFAADEKRPGGGARPGAGRPRAITDAALAKLGILDGAPGE